MGPGVSDQLEASRVIDAIDPDDAITRLESGLSGR
jgi:hypothetical protein